MERFVQIILDTDYYGTDKEFYIKTNMTDEQLNSFVNNMAIENAKKYNYMVYDFDFDFDAEDIKAEMDKFYERACVNSYWEEVTEEEAAENKYETLWLIFEIVAVVSLMILLPLLIFNIISPFIGAIITIILLITILFVSKE